ncbi:MAG: hypothetical protein AMXMBFR36_39000 [Acidobacteriota bacterium]
MRDPGQYKLAAKLIFERFVEQLEPIGFSRTRKNFLVRLRPHWVDFIRASCPPLHRDYQLHASVRILNDDFAGAGIVGPSTQAFDRRFNLWFVDSPDSIVRCAAEMGAWVSTVALPWFDAQSTEALLGAQSPLSPNTRSALAAALAGRSVPDNVRLSRRILGLES